MTGAVASILRESRILLIQSPLESDLCASDKTRGAVGNFSEDCNLSCARHRDESSAASAARESSFSPRTWSDWIPVTSTGMRVSNKPRRP
ncbi:hypothetical protein CN070_22920 [Sinorhizobium meliloti]|nr:hypothetical protein CN070_22920 [Sinorhizobium meliloti]